MKEIILKTFIYDTISFFYQLKWRPNEPNSGYFFLTAAGIKDDCS
tara:strand:+ start:291 stop:425 length:135 start_codon:yes stop_codon:yes gene_type:complete